MKKLIGILLVVSSFFLVHVDAGTGGQTSSGQVVRFAPDTPTVYRIGRLLGHQDSTKMKSDSTVAHSKAVADSIVFASYYSTGTWSDTLRGCTTSPAITVTWTKIFTQVCLEIPNRNCVSNSDSLTIGPIPLALRTTTFPEQPLDGVLDSGKTGYGATYLDNTGVIYYGVGRIQFVNRIGSFNNFVTSAQKGFIFHTFCYIQH